MSEEIKHQGMKNPACPAERLTVTAFCENQSNSLMINDLPYLTCGYNQTMLKIW